MLVDVYCAGYKRVALAALCKAGNSGRDVGRKGWGVGREGNSAADCGVMDGRSRKGRRVGCAGGFPVRSGTGELRTVGIKSAVAGRWTGCRAGGRGGLRPVEGVFRRVAARYWAGGQAGLRQVRRCFGGRRRSVWPEAGHVCGRLRGVGVRRRDIGPLAGLVCGRLGGVSEGCGEVSDRWPGWFAAG